MTSENPSAANLMAPVTRTLSVPDAGRILGIGRNSAYEAAKRGEIPTVKFGRLLRVPVVAVERMLDHAGHDGWHDADR